jgi:DNA-binding MarR family transcriptional regulator
MIHKRRHPTFVLTAGQARDIRARYARGGVSQTDLAHEYGVTPSCVNKIVRGTRQREVA